MKLAHLNAWLLAIALPLPSAVATAANANANVNANANNISDAATARTSPVAKRQLLDVEPIVEDAVAEDNVNRPKELLEGGGGGSAAASASSASSFGMLGRPGRPNTPAPPPGPGGVRPWHFSPGGDSEPAPARPVAGGFGMLGAGGGGSDDEDDNEDNEYNKVIPGLGLVKPSLYSVSEEPGDDEDEDEEAAEIMATPFSSLTITSDADLAALGISLDDASQEGAAVQWPNDRKGIGFGVVPKGALGVESLMEMMRNTEEEMTEVDGGGGNGGYGTLSVAAASTPGLVPRAPMFDGGLSVEELMRVEDEGWLEMGDAGEVSWTDDDDEDEGREDAEEEEVLEEAPPLPDREFQDYDGDSGIVPKDIVVIAPVDVVDEQPVEEAVAPAMPVMAGGTNVVEIVPGLGVKNPSLYSVAEEPESMNGMGGGEEEMMPVYDDGMYNMGPPDMDDPMYNMDPPGMEDPMYNTAPPGMDDPMYNTGPPGMDDPMDSMNAEFGNMAGEGGKPGLGEPAYAPPGMEESEETVMGMMDMEGTSRRGLRGGRKPLEKRAEYAVPKAPEDAVPNREALQGARNLQNANLGPAVATETLPDFAPLDCNADVDDMDCSGSDTANTLSYLLQQALSVDPAVAPVITIPCGTCIRYDLTGETTIAGLNVIGKLYAPPNHVHTLKTPYVLVQGELEMSDTNPISKDNASMTIVLTGNAPLTVALADAAATSLDIGIKAFVVAGGKLTIEGWDGADGEGAVVESWTPLLATAEQPRPRPALSNVPGQKELQEPRERALVDPPLKRDRATGGTLLSQNNTAVECPRKVLDHDFNAAVDHAVWSAGDGMIVHNEVGGHVVAGVVDYDWQGFKLDMTEIVQECPMIDTANYLITARLMIDKKGMTGQEIETERHPRLRRKIMRSSGGDKYYDQWIPKGVMGKYGEWFTFASVWQWKAADGHIDPSVETGTILNLDYFPIGSMVHMDSFTIELPSEKSYADPADACKELAINGDAEDTDGNGLHYYPFTSVYDYRSKPIILEEQVDDGTGTNTTVTNKYWQNRNRPNGYAINRFFPNPDCLVKGFVYTISQRLRIASGSSLSYYIRLAGYDPNNDMKDEYWPVLNCATQTKEDGWVTCSGPALVNEKWESYVNIRWEIYTVNEDSDNRAVIDLDDIRMEFKSGPAEGLKVDGIATPRWSANSDVHITSSTLHWKDSQEAVITAVEPQNDGSNTLKLDIGIAAVLSEADTPGMGVEVALLTRNIKILGENTAVDGEQCKPPACTGGYLQVLHTPGVAQVIEGVEFDNMGQQGGLNRFPLQFQYTKDVPGTSIARNTIRRSHHRCISMDGVSNATISANVAHDTAGHCYYVGYEAMDNLLVNNLGSRTNDELDYYESLPGHEDGNYRATFKVQNPQNNFIGNVAAGAAGRGWLCGLHYYTRGESNVDNKHMITEGGSMRRKYMGVFRGNKAHSNYYQGFNLQHYEQYFNIRDPVNSINPLFEDMYSYRNREHAIYTYNLLSPTFDGGVLSDNQWGLVLRNMDRITVNDFNITGSSQIFKDITETRSLKLCSHSSWDHEGIHMMTKIHRYDFREPNMGLKLKNVRFDGFDKEKTWYPHCKSTQAIGFSGDKTDGHFDYISSFEDVEVTDSRGLIMDGCKCNSMGVQDLVFNNLGGALHTSGRAGALVSNNTFVTDIFGNTCESVGHCMAYCPDVCLRTFSYKVSQFGTEDWKLKITNLNGTGEMLVPSTSYTRDDEKWNEKYFSYAWGGHRFSASLPAGSYRAEFVDGDGNTGVWPTYVEETWQKEPACSGFATKDMVELMRPEIQDSECAELVTNGGHDAMINTTEPWSHTFYDWSSANIKVGAGLRKDNSDAIITTDHYYHWTGIGQDIDSRCLSKFKGDVYEFSAWVKLVPNRNGEDENKPRTIKPIDPNREWWRSESPIMTYNGRKLRETATSNNEHHTTFEEHDVAAVARPYNPTGWNLIHGITRLPDTYRAFFEFERTPDWYNVILDEVSFTRMTCSNIEIARNGDLDQANNLTKYWDTWGGDVVLDIVPGYGGEGNALIAKDRPHYSHGPAQVINTDCLGEGDRLAFSAKVKYQKEGKTVHCDPNTWDGATRCSDILMYTKNEAGTRQYHRVAEVSTTTPDAEGWQHLTGTHTLSPEQVRAYTKIYFDGRETSHDIIVDNLSIQHAPHQCSNLVLNPSFTEGADYWSLSERRYSRMDLVSPGADGEGHAMHIFRQYWWHSMRQKLDSRCFVTGERYDITSTFRLLNATGHGAFCEENSISGDDACPHIRIYATSCEGGKNYWLPYYNKLDNFEWDTESFNDFSAEISVTDAMASCKDHWLYVSGGDTDLDIVVDDLQISSYQTAAPTTSPTAGQTTAKVSETSSPTTSPTTMPTRGSITELPNKELISTEISSGPHMLPRSSSLCVLTKAAPVNGTLTSIAPVALSYDGGDWEKAAGEFATALLRNQEFGDYTDGSHITLPALDEQERYYLTSYSHELDTNDEKLARLLETATFGTTDEDLISWNKGNLTTATAKSWIEEQMALDMTSHREFFRLRTNPRAVHPVGIARTNHPCDPKSRWRKFAFSRKDGDLRWNPQQFEAIHREGNAYVEIRLNGHIRTVVRNDTLNFSDDSDYTFEYNREYLMCNLPQEYEDGWFWLRVNETSRECEELPNPLVHFYDNSPNPTNVLILPDVSEGVLQHIDEHQNRGGEYILFNGLNIGANANVCDQLNDVTEERDPPVFGQLRDGSWLQFDPRLKLEENTIDSPLPDGGGLVNALTSDETRCANAPRTFLNEDFCSLSNSSHACGSAGTPNLMIELDANNIKKFHTITGQYVYAILGLPLIDVNGVSQPSPCEPGLNSRWEIMHADLCNATAMGAQTNASLVELLLGREGSDTNTHLRDIYFPVSGDGFVCDAADISLVEASIIIGSQCFKRVHPEHLSVYDFTWWTQNTTHPGNMVAAMHNHSHPIKKWMDIDGGVVLHYPAEAPPPGINDHLAAHPIERWNTYSSMFSKLGRFGDAVKFVDLPNEIRLDEVAEEFGAETDTGGSHIIVCGSPNEAANDGSLGQVFEVTTGRDTTWGLDRQREYLWMQVALTAKDQLRQRVAWALAQLLVIAQGAIGVQGSHTEPFTKYYDIFVRNAFGNYRDVLREVSYSPLMAENLSYLQSKSAAYTWEHQGKISFADENFAREIMQLFSTGLVKLNLDGTPMVDTEGNPLLAYTNDEIMSFARVWTGFDYQQKRGNVEETSWSGNRHDPMKVQAGWRDKFPKTDMTGGYIGDGFPVCADLPEKMFLRKGAEYRLLGASHMPELMEDDSSFKTDPTLRKFVLNSTSNLKSALCGGEELGDSCIYNNIVTLQNNLDCVESECDADTLRVVQINDVHYEYVRPPCVEQTFYKDAKKIIWRHRTYDSSCANPLLPYASEACCEGQHDLQAERSPTYLYDQERVLYSTAGSRCQAMNPAMVNCDFYDIVGIDNNKKGYHWTTDNCVIQVKVDATGQVALVYDPESYDVIHPHVREDNRNFFKVYWDGDYPKNDADVLEGNSCGNSTCESLPTGGCLCATSIKESPIFTEMPRSVDEVLSTLTIGAYDTTAYDNGTYTEPIEANGVKVYLSASTLVYDTKTVVEVTDEYGRLQRLKNTYERVRIQGAPEMAFRNAPSFMSVLNSEADARDAYYETEAALDHYFHHRNTPPFVAHRLIQRFTTSNPRPRYVKAVATAFKTGSYDGIGSGKYGDLGATIAAVLLDPEARSINLDADPFKGNLREPILRMTALMRGMELEQAEGQSLVKMSDLDTKIGQQAHSFPTVFSFMLPEYAPGGRPADATLVGPETMIMDMPKVVSLLNGMFSLVKYGLSRCNGGFGTEWTHCTEGDFTRATAHLSFSMTYAAPEGERRSLQGEDPKWTHAKNVVNKLATVLTSGRLSAENKELISQAYYSKLNDTSIDDPSGSALRFAQQLLLTTPEFHTNNLVSKTGAARAEPDPPTQTNGTSYKAIVYVMFGGGCDSFNMLVPHTCNGDKDMWQEYVDIRQDIALTKTQLNVLNRTIANQVCETFAVHPQLLSVQEMFNDGDLLFFANTGVLTKKTDKENYWKDTETQLFAHNWMQQAAQRIDPLKAKDGTGILGRIRDVLTIERELSVGAFSLDINSISLIGEPGVTASPMILSNNGIASFNPAASSDDMDATIAALNGETKTESGVFGEWYSDTLTKSLSHNKLLYETLYEMTTEIVFPTSHLGRQLSMVAKMVDSRVQRGTDADVFFLSTGGWDTHSMLLANQERLFGDVDDAFNAFAREMKFKNVWDSVTLIQTSDFARTLTQNGGRGSDHAWGGNYIMMGGSVKGGQIVGKYPDQLEEGRAPLNIGRGRIIPTTSWEAVFLPLAEWAGAGVNPTDLNYIFPNRGSFEADHFFKTSDLFEPTPAQV